MCNSSISAIISEDDQEVYDDIGGQGTNTASNLALS